LRTKVRNALKEKIGEYCFLDAAKVNKVEDAVKLIQKQIEKKA